MVGCLEHVLHHNKLRFLSGNNNFPEVCTHPELFVETLFWGHLLLFCIFLCGRHQSDISSGKRVVHL